MPTSDILLLSLFILSFVGLAAVLAWGDYQTHDIAKASRARALAGVGSEPPEPEAEPQVAVRRIEGNKPTEERKQARTPVHA